MMALISPAAFPVAFPHPSNNDRMAQRWPAPNVKPKLRQEEFDDAVKTNIEDFDMQPDEAVKNALQEFSLQGYDVGCVIQTVEGAATFDKHPVTQATSAIKGSSPAQVQAAFEELQQVLDKAVSDGQEAVQQASAVALKQSSLQAVLDSLRAAHQAGGDNSVALQAGLCVSRALMAPSLDIRDTFDDLSGPALLMDLHQAYTHDIPLQAEVARAAECASFREEQNKERLIDYGVSVLQLLAEHSAAAGNGVSEPFVSGACGILRSLCTADDDRPPCSKAFSTARLLSRQHQALKVLLAVLRCLSGPDSAPTVAGVLSTVRQLAANEEICNDFSDEGGVCTCLDLIRSMSAVSKDVVRCGLGALRQLTHSDVTKRLLADKEAAPLLMKLTAAYPEDVEVIEPALGVMANMTLRQPEVVTAIAEVGVVGWVLDLMRQLPASSLVQRQSAILLRNMVVRNPELRPTFLEQGAEALLRAAKKAHPKNCTDVGSAALRDLGLDKYNE